MTGGGNKTSVTGTGDSCAVLPATMMALADAARETGVPETVTAGPPGTSVAVLFIASEETSFAVIVREPIVSIVIGMGDPGAGEFTDCSETEDEFNAMFEDGITGKADDIGDCCIVGGADVGGVMEETDG